MINIILAEDHIVVRAGIKFLLETDTDIHVIGEASNGLEVLELLAEGDHADIVLADMEMPGMGGNELIVELKKNHPEIDIVILSMIENENTIFNAFSNGAKGYLLKLISRAELIYAIKHVYNNGKYLSSELSQKIIQKSLNSLYNSKPDQIDILFTSREKEVLSLISEGFTNHEMSEKLFLSKRTVEGHRQSLIGKTGSRNTAALIRYALLHGILH
jgi:DNA-binding NarL/FixJ family response regulator